MLAEQNHRLSAEARELSSRYIALRKTRPLFSNAPLDPQRARPHSAPAGESAGPHLDRVRTSNDLTAIEANDVLAAGSPQQGRTSPAKPP